MNAAMRAAVVAGLVFMVGLSASADVFNMGGTRNLDGSWTGLTSLETLLVGDQGNAADTRYVTPGYGSVGYAYSIGRYEVTAGQYCQFLNAVARTDTYNLYHQLMWTSAYGCKIQQSGSSGSYTYGVAADSANRPVNWVSWGDAARFCNWLYNGQPVGPQGLGTTEDGSYYLNGSTSDKQLLAVIRKPEASWGIPSEDEWYKAAYYKGGSTNAGYWDYPTANNIVPSNEVRTPDPGNNANIMNSGGQSMSVGEFENSRSPYGTFDQGGNVWERVETAFDSNTLTTRGGSWYSTGGGSLHASFRSWGYATAESDSYGFRVVEIPEPATLSLLSLAGSALLARRRGRGTRLRGRR